jgi:WD40 repeat protein
VSPEPANPYVGPYAFRAEDAHLFFGREREVESLASLVIAESIVLFFAPSGTGKTSLVQARLLPELRAAGFDVLPVARVGAEPPAGTAPVNAYVFSALCALAPDTDPARLQSLTLGSYLWTLPESGGGKARRVLVLDQFEEILAPRRGHWEEREDFFLQLRQALQDEPSLSVLLVMREDNLAGLEPFAPLLPGRLRTRFRMESLRGEDAIAAVARPARAARPFEPGVAEQLVDDLRRVEVDEVDGRAASYRGELVEPLQLQVVCYELWEKLRERPGETITAADLAACGDIGQALESFYERAVERASGRSGVPPERLRAWCGQALITPRRLRSQVDRAERSTAGLDNRAVDELVETRLVRKQEIRGGTWYELVHDRFIEPVLRVNERRLQEESTPLGRDARDWERSGRDPSYLYRGQQLADALMAAPDSAALSEVEKTFLTESQAHEAQRSILHRRQAARLRRLAAALGVMLVIAAALAVYAYRESRQSKSRALAAEAVNLGNMDPDLGLFRALAAVDTAATPEAETALYRLLNAARVRKLWSKPMKSANAVAFSPDGSHLAAVGDGGEVLLVENAPVRRIARKLTGSHTAAVTSVAFSPDGRWLATGDSEGTVFVRRASGELALPRLALGPEAANVNGLAFSPDGEILAVASDSNVPTLWSIKTGQRIMELRGGHADVVWEIAFSGDGRSLATGGADKRVVLWDLKTGAPRVLGEHAGAVTGVAFRPGAPGRPALLASSSRDGTVQLWHLDSGSHDALYGHKDEVWSVAFSPDGASLATASFDGTAKIWDVASGEELFTLSPGAGKVVKVAFSPEQGLVATASRSAQEEDQGLGGVTEWKVFIHDEAQELSLAAGILGKAFQKGGRLFAGFGATVQGTLWNIKPGTEEQAVSPDGRFLVAVNGRTMKLSRLQGGSWMEAQELTGDSPVRAVAFSRDGKRLAAGLGDGRVVVLDTAAHKMLTVTVLLDPATHEVLTLSGHQGAVLAVAFSPDGTRLASGSIDHTAKLWDPAKGAEIATFPGHRAAVSSVAFNNEGTMLATGDTSGTVRLETLKLPELIARARRRLAQR